MNGEELRAYTCLTHPTSAESYWLSEDGKRLYVMETGFMVCLEGEGLDKMGPGELYAWYLSALRDWKIAHTYEERHGRWNRSHGP